MVTRFGEFEFDEAARSLTLRGQGLSVQPKVFDLLAYLVRHAGRVVSKRELMEQLWPDVHVSEASLQRAVSLLRSTLRQGDAEPALKSFSGHGYRFAVDQPDLRALLPAPEAEPPAHASEARAAAGVREWSVVVARLGACADPLLSAQDYELWAFALECLGRPGEALPLLQKAVERHETAKSKACAARCATSLGKIHLERGEPAVARGWLARAAALLPSPVQFLSLARQLWTSIGVEHQAARVRLELAKLLLASGDRAGALVELSCARDSAERAGAMTLAQEAAQLVEKLG